MPGRGRGLRTLPQVNQNISNMEAGLGRRVSNVDSAETEQVVSFFALITSITTYFAHQFRISIMSFSEIFRI